jgi:hypothetical protein
MTFHQASQRPPFHVVEGDPSAASLQQAWGVADRQLRPEAPPFQFAIAFDIDGTLDSSVVRHAIWDVTRHHRGLRDRVVIDRGRVSLEDGLDAPDVTASDAYDVELDDVLAADATRPFRPGQDAPWRAVVALGRDTSSVLQLTFDHLAVDGWSLRIVLEDLGMAVGARLTGAVASLPPATDYRQYIASQLADAETRIERAADHLHAQLDGDLDVLDVRLPSHTASLRLDSPHDLSVTVPNAVADAVTGLCRTHRATMQTVLTAAIGRVVGRATDRDRVPLLNSSANRRSRRYARTVGWFANGLFPVVQADCDNTASLLTNTARTISDGQAHADVPAWYPLQRIAPDRPMTFRTESSVHVSTLEGTPTPLQWGPFRLRSRPAYNVDTCPGIRVQGRRADGEMQLRMTAFGSEYSPSALAHLAADITDELARFGGMDERAVPTPPPVDEEMEA